MTATANIEKYRRDFSNPALYNPAFIPLIHNTAEFLHLYGSAGSGKSRFIAQKEIIKSYREERRGRKTLVVRKIGVTLKDSVYSELKTVIYDWRLSADFVLLKSPLSITNQLTGVQFLFIGLDDVEKVKSISGVDRIWIEEATELAEKKELDQLRLRMRGFPQVQITLSYNPIDEYHWINTDIHQTGEAGHFLSHSTYRDNIQMLRRDPNYAVYVESLAESNPNYYRVYGKGLWGRVIEGLIYDRWDVIEDFGGEVQAYGLDFGYSDPHALVELRIEDASPKKKLIVRERLYKPGLDATELIAEFDALGINKKLPIVADSARPEMIKSLQKAGYNVSPSAKAPGSVLTGINKIRGYQLQVVAGSKNGLRELQNYQKAQVKKTGQYLEEPGTNQVDHFCDAVRYGEQALSKGKWAVDFRPMR